MLCRRKSFDDMIAFVKSLIRHDETDARFCPPPRNLRRATEADIVPGAIVWTGVRSKTPSVQQWAIIESRIANSERMKSRGPGFLYRSTIYRIRNCWIEKTP